jgi:DNA-directed RNA polymerase subunit RPC12/RpoP
MAEKLVLHSRSMSPCHNDVNVLVLSRANGFVTQNCNTCGTPQPLNLWELPELKCDECGVSLSTFVNILKNYSYKCNSCQRECQLADLVPAWHDKFEYHGFAIPNVDIHFGW